VSRQGRKPHARRAKPAAASSAGAGTISILPMDIQIGDRFTDEEGEWEVVSHPATLHGAKSLRTRVIITTHRSASDPRTQSCAGIDLIVAA